MQATAMAIENSTVAEVAPIYNLTPESLIQHLEDNGYQVTSENQSLNDIAKAAGQSDGRQIFVLTATVQP